MSQWITTREAWSHVSFFERDLAQRRIFAKLIEGTIPAWAAHYTLNGSEHWDTEMPSAFWDIQWTRLDFASGKATRAVFDVFASIDEHGERVVRQHSSDSATGVRLDRDMLQTFWPPIPQGIPATEETKA
jgi:hypothetical protein